MSERQELSGPITLASTPPDQMDKAQWRRSSLPSVQVAKPYDPRPLMAALAGRLDEGKFSFAFLADPHHSEGFARIARLLPPLGVDFVLIGGDLVDLGGGREGPINYGRLEHDSGELLRRLPVWPAIGNHDTDSRWVNDVWNGFANFQAFFGLPPYYSFSAGACRFIVLSWMLPDQAELAWLSAELEAAGQARHIFVMSHYPLAGQYCVIGSATENAQYVQRPEERQVIELLTRYRVRAHLSGHAHIYFRTVRAGVNYILCGSAASKIHGLSPLKDGRPGDSFYGLEEETGQYLLHVGRPDGNPPVESRRAALTNCFVIMDVDDASVSGRLISESGQVWEHFSL